MFHGGAISSDGTNVQLYYINGTEAQKFKFTSINIISTSETYEIETKLNSSMVIDIAGASSDNGANAQLYTASNTDCQRFTLEAISSDTYVIRIKHSNKVLDVAGGGTTNGTNVWQYEYNGTAAQQWQIKEAGNGYYYIISVLNGLYLDVDSALTSNGTNIQLYTGNSSNAQQFRFVTGYRTFYEEGTYGSSGLVYAGDSRGQSLKYYKYGQGSKVIFLTFSMHGFEDSYSHDGTELTNIAEDLKTYLDNNITEDIVNEWTIYIFPDANPDGQVYGYTNNGPGRTTLYSAASGHTGVDMNRTWSVGFKVLTSSRNYTGSSAFLAYEAQSLRSFLLSHKGSTNYVIDTHGWLNETIGDSSLGKYYRNQYGISTHLSTYGSGYLINWALTLGNTRSVLVELPEISSHSQAVSRNYSTKFINATMQLIGDL